MDSRKVRTIRYQCAAARLHPTTFIYQSHMMEWKPASSLRRNKPFRGERPFWTQTGGLKPLFLLACYCKPVH